jgi:hypothetical protein
VAVLRMAAARRPDDMVLAALIGELHALDADFRAWWDAQAVSGAKLRRKSYHHPVVGQLTMDAHVLTIEGEDGLSLVTYTAVAEHSSEEALRSLLRMAPSD